MNDQDLAGLPRDVRVAASVLEAQLNFHHREQWHVIRAELLRLAHDCAEHAAWRDINERARFDQQQRAERAEAELAAIKATPTGTVLDWALRRAEKVESELAALKRRIAEAPVMRIDPVGDGAYWSMADGTSINELNELIGQRVALLPVGGE